jgi:aryl-alcohol dehydrogenase-like predicted oxidoreductase
MLADAVAITYVMQKTSYVFPLVEGRKVEHLQGNMEALEISSFPKHIKYLESVIPFDPGFPTTMIVGSSNFSHIHRANAHITGRWVIA